MKKVTLMVAVLGAMLFTSCKTRLIDFTIISSKNVTLRLPDDAKGPRSSGKEMKTCATPQLKGAVDKAIENAGPGYDALIDGVIYNKNNYISNGWVVEGTPIKTSKLKASN
jgi:hypothetical protein